MDENKKKQRRVSFASEAPEQNVYDKELTITSFTTDDITADITCEQTKVGKSFYDDIKEEDKENDSVMSNNTAVFDELVNTQYIRTIVPQQKSIPININELLMENGIRFLDDIVVSSTRRETLSKSKKEVDPRNVVYYKYFLSHRIKFFEDFSEDLKNELSKLSDEIKQVENNFEIKNSLLEKEDKSQLRSLKSDCRNRANVSWYELRAKKELEFNDLIIKIKNELTNEFNKKENCLEQIKLQTRDLEENIKFINEKLETFKIHDMANITNLSLDKLQQDIVNHEQVLEEYLTEYERLKIDVNNKIINDESNEMKYLNLKNEIIELEKQFRTVNINENDLTDSKTEYEKLTAIFGIEILAYKNHEIVFNFLNYEITMDLKDKSPDSGFCTLKNIRYSATKSIIHEYGVIILKKNNTHSFLEIIRFLNIIHELCKEISYILVNNSVDIYIENEELKILINVNDILKFEKYKIKALVNSKMDILIETGGESYLYNLYTDKRCIINHIE